MAKRLATAQVYQFGVAPEVQNHVFGFQVAVHDGAHMKVLQSQSDAATVKPQCWIYFLWNIWNISGVTHGICNLSMGMQVG